MAASIGTAAQVVEHVAEGNLLVKLRMNETFKQLRHKRDVRDRSIVAHVQWVKCRLLEHRCM